METNALTDIELRRYKKQIEISEIGEKGQLKLKHSRILVVGAGSLGTPVLQYLAAAGVGTIGICDADYVDESNFYRQIMYGASDLGKLKTIVAKEKLSLLNPFTQFEIINMLIKSENAESVIRNFEVIIDCSNNFSVSQILNETCLKLKKPLVWAFISGFNGFLSIMDNCNFNQLSKNNSSTIKSVNKKIDSLGLFYGIIGSLQANEVLKLLLNSGEPLIQKILIFDGLKSEFKIELI